MEEQHTETNIVKKIVSVSTSVLLALSLVFFAYVVFQINSGKGRVNLFGYSVYSVVSESMEPTIPVGGLIIMKECPIEDVKEGDIVCFSSVSTEIRGETVTHRVVEREITENGSIRLYTRGDNPNTTTDAAPVTKANFLGVVVSYTGQNSFWISAYVLLTSPIGFFTCIGIPVVLILVVVVRHSLKTIKEEIEDMKRLSAVQAQEEKAEKTADATENKSAAPTLDEEELASLKQKITAEVKRELSERRMSAPDDPPAEEKQPRYPIRTEKAFEV